MNPFDRAMNHFKEKIEAVKETKSEGVRDRLDTELGIYLVKNVGTLFWFDKNVRAYEQEIKELARAGEKEEAIEVAEQLQGYVSYQMQHSRRYKSHMKKVSKKLEGRGEKFMAKAEKLKGSRLVEWVEKMNTRDADEFEDVLDELEDDTRE